MGYAARRRGVDEAYPFDILDGEPSQIDMRPSIAVTVVEVCRRLRAREGIGRVCLSGGTNM